MNDNQKNRLTAFLLLLLFLSFQGGRMLFFHTHVFGNVIVSHSHPLCGNNSHHTPEELISIASISNCVLTDNSAPEPELSVPDIFVMDVIECENLWIFQSFDSTLKGRDPPYLHV